MTDSTESLSRKIGSAGELQGVVRTMKALAASSIGQFEKSVQALADYYRTVQLGICACVRENRFLASRELPREQRPSGVIRAIVFGSDQGLVGQFNDTIAEYALQRLGDQQGACRVWAIGERVHARLAEAGLPLAGLFQVPNSVQAIAPLIAQIQIHTEVHRNGAPHPPLWVFHNRPTIQSVYQPVGQRLLPLDAQWRSNFANVQWPTGNLPEVMGNGLETLRTLIREYLFISLFRACAESLASENASRLAAMQRADKNISELLEQLSSEFHQLRQSGIDDELFDVVSGFEALLGSR